VVVSVTSPLDVSFGSCGSLLPGYEARIVDADGNDLGHDEPGELLLRSPSIMLGYLDNREETDKNFTHDNWLRTGDMVEIRLSNNGHDHIYIVDRIKELIKVKVRA
jgi:long-subunit acyl-CoA synthetase (AMP-forming)